jgi:hypothetical protein
MNTLKNNKTRRHNMYLSLGIMLLMCSISFTFNESGTTRIFPDNTPAFCILLSAGSVLLIVWIIAKVKIKMQKLNPQLPGTKENP